jgi:glycosyltransferase involved in cell wall biosynthesis
MKLLRDAAERPHPPRSNIAIERSPAAVAAIRSLPQAGGATLPHARSVTFSVVIPVYNRSHLIRRTLRSVLAQNFQNFEIIVVDDGSNDNLYDSVAGMDDDRIIYIRQPNRGASAARNRGVDEARGAYVAFLDSDDRFLPHHLETAANALSGAQDLAFYAPVIALRTEHVGVVKPPRPLRPDEDIATYLMCDRGFVQTSGLVVPRGMARRVRYREDARFGDDTDFAIRLQRAGCRFEMASSPGVIWSDAPSPSRLSGLGIADLRLPWLEDLRPVIPKPAYDGYRGWHLAKAMYRRHPITAMRLYVSALRSGSYNLRLAVTIFCQIVLPPSLYRRAANAVIRIWGNAARSSRLPAL